MAVSPIQLRNYGYICVWSTYVVSTVYVGYQGLLAKVANIVLLALPTDCSKKGPLINKNPYVANNKTLLKYSWNRRRQLEELRTIV